MENIFEGADNFRRNSSARGKTEFSSTIFLIIPVTLGAPYSFASRAVSRLVEIKQMGQHYTEPRRKLENQLTADSSIYLSEADGLSACQQTTSVLNSSDGGLLHFQCSRISGDTT